MGKKHKLIQLQIKLFAYNSFIFEQIKKASYSLKYLEHKII